jgi:mannosyl-3-phosphoglycerate phosphatase
MDVVISDLDGTLLDHDSYSFEDALPGLTLLKQKHIPLVFCSSKTRRESDFWRALTGNEHPFIVENGGAVVIPSGYFAFPIPSGRVAGEHVIIQLGDSYTDLVNCLEEAAAETGCGVRGFHQMTIDEVAHVCDLKQDSATLAKDREFDEPFVIIDKDKAAALLAAIERRGKRWTRGGRFHHILGNNDKAAAVITLLNIYRLRGEAVRSIGFGDGMNDAAFLTVVDVPILIRTRWLPELQAAVPNAKATVSAGPRGWNEAILQLFG